MLDGWGAGGGGDAAADGSGSGRAGRPRGGARRACARTIGAGRDPRPQRGLREPLREMEYDRGDGPPVLMIHGTGGGFDQGLAFASRSSPQAGRSSRPRVRLPALGLPGRSVLGEPGRRLRRPPRPPRDRPRAGIGGSAGALSAMAVRDPPPGPLRGARRAGPPPSPRTAPAAAAERVAEAIIAYGLRSDSCSGSA